MPVIPNRQEFEPSRDSLNLWLATRKNKEGSAIVTRPGLFFTRDIATDQTAFLIVIVFELIGLALLVYGGFTKDGGRFVLVTSLVAFSLFLADIALAMALHRNEAEKCRSRNALLLEQDNALRTQYQDTLKRGGFLNILIIFIMLLIALVKMAGIILLGSGLDHIGIVLSLAIMFLLIVFIHVRYTGYYLAELRTSKAFKREFNAYNYGTVDAVNKRIGLAEERSSIFTYNGDDLLGVDKEGNKRDVLNGNNSSVIHRLQVAEDGTTWKYQITTQGILTDEDITAFLNKKGLDNQQISRLAAVCLDHQFAMLTR